MFGVQCSCQANSSKKIHQELFWEILGRVCLLVITYKSRFQVPAFQMYLETHLLFRMFHDLQIKSETCVVPFATNTIDLSLNCSNWFKSLVQSCPLRFLIMKVMLHIFITFVTLCFIVYVYTACVIDAYSMSNSNDIKLVMFPVWQWDSTLLLSRKLSW